MMSGDIYANYDIGEQNYRQFEYFKILAKHFGSVDVEVLMKNFVQSI